MTQKVEDFFSKHAKDLGILLIIVIGAYFTIQTNTKDIASLSTKIEEIEGNKVSNATMVLKEQYLKAELERIEDDIHDIEDRLDKKVRILNEADDNLEDLKIETAVLCARVEQTGSELRNIWNNYNRINCK